MDILLISVNLWAISWTSCFPAPKILAVKSLASESGKDHWDPAGAPLPGGLPIMVMASSIMLNDEVRAVFSRFVYPGIFSTASQC